MRGSGNGSSPPGVTEAPAGDEDQRAEVLWSAVPRVLRASSETFPQLLHQGINEVSRSRFSIGCYEKKGFEHLIFISIKFTL